MAYKFGKWRAIPYFLATPLPLIFATLMLSVFGILPGNPSPPTAVQWIGIILYGSGSAIGICGCYQLYRDHVHHDYYQEADRYQREGW
ncbi:hypothetical protein [Comamonas antarctica]|uniref:Transmembrane protein n=1 Tax=Comamonas antarctica TaxID=2743470 RepID=A0A6N1XBZ6_9BURK|nr:hypothetical protein [Comamonas antarctica]QKV55455.1 hypothetical protein HUK68_21295 [Comamonas antarctica]